MKPPPEQQPRIAFLLGKPLRGPTVLSEVLDRLRDVPASVTTHLASGTAPLPSWLFDSDLIVQRLGMPGLTCALPLERVGVRCCNRISATITTCDRALTIQKLADAGVPVPATAPATTWSELRDLAEGRPVVVKAARVATGRGVGVFIAATGSLPALAPFAGPFIAQEYVRCDERDYKVYVAGCDVRGLLKRPPLRQTADEPGVPFSVELELADLAHLTGAALGLEIYGVDFLYGPNGPVVVDVNPFPGFRGVPQAAQLIVRHLTAIACRQDRL